MKKGILVVALTIVLIVGAVVSAAPPDHSTKGMLKNLTIGISNIFENIGVTHDKVDAIATKLGTTDGTVENIAINLDAVESKMDSFQTDLIEIMDGSVKMHSFSGELSPGEMMPFHFGEVRHFSLTLYPNRTGTDTEVKIIIDVGGESITWLNYYDLVTNKVHVLEIDTNSLDLYWTGISPYPDGTLYYNITTTYPD